MAVNAKHNKRPMPGNEKAGGEGVEKANSQSASKELDFGRMGILRGRKIEIGAMVSIECKLRPYGSPVKGAIFQRPSKNGELRRKRI